jgi:transaldolase
MPPATIIAFNDHGNVVRTVDKDFAGAHKTIHAIEAAGVAIESVTDKLLVDGVASFQKSFDTLLAGLAGKMKQLGKELVTSS